LNKKLEIVQSGPSLIKIMNISSDKKFSSNFEITIPTAIDITSFRSFKRIAEQTTILQTIDRTDLANKIKLKGEFILLEEQENLILFAGTPILSSINEALKLGLCLSDFASHDPSRGVLFATDAAIQVKIPKISKKEEKSDSKALNFLGSLFNSRIREKKIKKKRKKKKELFKVMSAPVTFTPYKELDEQRDIGREKEILERKCPFTNISTSLEYQESGLQIASKLRLVCNFEETLLQDSWHNFQVINTLLTIALKQDMDEDLFTAVVKYYSHKNRVIELLQAAIYQEFEICSNQSSIIFRTDSIATRLISKYFDIEGTEYLNLCLINSVNAITSLPFENDAEKKHENAKILLKIAKDTLNDISKSAAQCPISMRIILQFISVKAIKQIPNYEISCLLNILFLRFFGTALANLKKIKLNKRPTETNLRVGVIITKLLQQLVNSTDGYEPNNGEENIQNIAKQFINIENQNLVLNYLAELISDKGMHLPAQFHDISDKESAYHAGNALVVIRNFVSSNIEKVLSMSTENKYIRQMLVNLLQLSFSEMNIKRY